MKTDHIASIEATLDRADVAIDRAYEQIAASLRGSVNSPAYLAGLIRARDAAKADRDAISRLLAEEKLKRYRAERAEALSAGG